MLKEGKWLYDEKCDESLLRFLEELSEFNSVTGREYTVVVIPHEPDDDVLVSLDGKPQEVCESEAVIAVSIALTIRENYRKELLGQLRS